MIELNFRQLIDLTIGSPEPGHVNFYALRCLLFSFADKLNVSEEPVDCNKYGNVQMIVNSGKRGSEIQLDKKDSNKNDEPKMVDPMEIEEQVEPSMPETALQPETTLGPKEVLIAERSDVDDAEILATPSGGLDRSNIDEAPSIVEISPAGISVARSSISDTSADSCNTHEAPPESPKPTEFQTIAYPSTRDLLKSHTETAQQVAVRRYSATTGDLDKTVAIMKDQLELAMEELLTIAAIVAGNKSISKMQQLLSLSSKLRSVQRKNVFVEGLGFKLDDEVDTSWQEYELEELRDETGMEEESIELRSQFSQVEQSRVEDRYNLELHMCYSPEKLLNQLLELKTDFCMLTNKVNELTATIHEQDFTRTKTILREQQDDIREVKYNSARLAETLQQAETKQLSMIEAIHQINQILDEVKQTKSDKDEIEILLANKVDYKQLQRKVSLEQLLELKCTVEKEFCEMHKLIDANETNSTQLMENVSTKLGENMDVVLKNFKEKIDLEIKKLQEKLQKFIESTGECAAGGRTKALQDLACLSCDTTCAMKTMERSKVPKMANAYASNLLSPLITYELSSIRKSGIMGYYRKDDFPHSPSAWMNRQNMAMKTCAPRRAGGEHTTSTAKERVEKIVVQRK